MELMGSNISQTNEVCLRTYAYTKNVWVKQLALSLPIPLTVSIVYLCRTAWKEYIYACPVEIDDVFVLDGDAYVP